MAKYSNLDVLSALHPTVWRTPKEIFDLVNEAKGIIEDQTIYFVIIPILERLKDQGFVERQETRLGKKRKAEYRRTLLEYKG